MPPETVTAPLIVEKLRTLSLNEHPDVPRHDQLIRLALRRRRVEIRPVAERTLVFVFGGVVVGGMNAEVTTLVSAHARRITSDPTLMRRHLQLQEVPTTGDVTAPSATEAPGAATSPGPTEQVAGAAALRVFVVGERVAAAVLHLPMFVLGDGRSTLRALLDAGTRARGRHGLLAGQEARFDDAALRDLGLDPEQVPESEELVLLQPRIDSSTGARSDADSDANTDANTDSSTESRSSAAAGPSDDLGVHLDLTEDLPDSLLELAVDAVAAVPGLNAAAVDLEVPDLESGEGAAVSAIVPEADIRSAHFPSLGTARDVAGAIAEEILLRASR